MPHFVQEDCCQETERNQCCPGLGCCGVGDGGFKSTFEEIIHPAASMMSSDTTLAAWGISRPQRLGSGNTDSSHFTFVNSSGVIATGSGSCNCVDNLVINLDGHAVTSLNGFDFVPADSNFAQHIGNDDSFIEENNLWFQEEHVGTQSYCCANSENFDESVSSGNNEIVSNKTEAQENAETKKDKVTSRTVNQRITHSRIITHKSNQGSKEALA